jgi:hypothetical protein
MKCFTYHTKTTRHFREDGGANENNNSAIPSCEGGSLELEM